MPSAEVAGLGGLGAGADCALDLVLAEGSGTEGVLGLDLGGIDSECVSGRSGRLWSHRCILRVQKIRPWALTRAL